MFSNANLLASAALLSLASAVTHIVDVGKNGLTFTPNSTAAAIGDVVEFHFYPKNHTVTQTSFASPCQANLNSGFFSGFMPVSSGEAVSQPNAKNTKSHRYLVSILIWCLLAKSISSDSLFHLPHLVLLLPSEALRDWYGWCYQ